MRFPVAMPTAEERVKHPTLSYMAERAVAMGLEGATEHEFEWVKRHAPHRCSQAGKRAPIPWWPAVTLNVLTCGHLAAGARKCIECLGVIGVADRLNDTAGFYRWRARTEKAKRKGQNKAGNREARAFESADAEWERSQA